MIIGLFGLDPIIAFLLAIVSVLVCAIVAGNKNRNGFGWMLLGFLFGPLAMLAVAMTSPLPSSKEKHQAEADQAAREQVQAGGASEKYRKCPFCAEVVLREAIKCKHCHSDLPPLEGAPAPGAASEPPPT